MLMSGGGKPFLTSCEVACVREQVAKRIGNIRFIRCRYGGEHYGTRREKTIFNSIFIK